MRSELEGSRLLVCQYNEWSFIHSSIHSFKQQYTLIAHLFLKIYACILYLLYLHYFYPHSLTFPLTVLPLLNFMSSSYDCLTWTHTRVCINTTFWVHLMLLICTYVQGWWLRVGKPMRGSSTEKTDSLTQQLLSCSSLSRHGTFWGLPNPHRQYKWCHCVGL